MLPSSDSESPRNLLEVSRVGYVIKLSYIRLAGRNRECGYTVLSIVEFMPLPTATYFKT